MTEGTSTAGSAEAKKVETQIDQTMQQIEKQAEKVDSAQNDAEARKESAALESLMKKLEGLTERLDSIDKRLGEPTVPAPEAKAELPPVKKASETGEVKGANDATEAKPRKRRLGAWGG